MKTIIFEIEMSHEGGMSEKWQKVSRIICRQFHQRFSYEFFVGMLFFYVHVTREKLPKQRFVRKMRVYNVD